MVYYYKKKLPSVDDVVIATVTDISEYGIKVRLNEFNDVEGFINCGEVSRKKRVNFNKIFTVGKEVLAIVTGINTEKKFIDLSKRTIGDEDIKLFTTKHKTHIQLYNLFKHFYIKHKNLTNANLAESDCLYEFMNRTLWEIQTEYEDEYILEKLLNKDTNNEILEIIDYDSWELTMEELKNIVDFHIDTKINRVKPELIDTIKLLTYHSTGLADIKYSMNFTNFPQSNSLDADFNIKINYINGSTYTINIQQKEFDLIGSVSIEDALIIIKENIKSRAIERNIQHQIPL